MCKRLSSHHPQHLNAPTNASHTSSRPPLPPKKRVLIAVKDTVTFQPHQVTLDPNGWYIILTCTINNVNYTLINIYAPNVHQMRFLKHLTQSIKPIQRGHVNMCGDFNLVPDTWYLALSWTHLLHPKGMNPL